MTAVLLVGPHRPKVLPERLLSSDQVSTGVERTIANVFERRLLAD